MFELNVVSNAGTGPFDGESRKLHLKRLKPTTFTGYIWGQVL